MYVCMYVFVYVYVGHLCEPSNTLSACTFVCAMCVFMYTINSSCRHEKRFCAHVLYAHMCIHKNQICAPCMYAHMYIQYTVLSYFVPSVCMHICIYSIQFYLILCLVCVCTYVYTKLTSFVCSVCM